MHYQEGQQFALAQLRLEKNAGLAELLNAFAAPVEAMSTAGRYAKDFAHIGGRAFRDILPTMAQGDKARRVATKTIAEAPLPAREVERFQAVMEHARTDRLPKEWSMAPEGLTPVHISELPPPRHAVIPSQSPVTTLKAAAAFSLKVAKAHKLSRRMEFRGLKISVETDKGESRHWYDPHNKEKGSTKMKYAYGYIRRTEGIDGDHVDVYVGPNEDAKNVYVVHQQKAPNFDGYDEDKCMLGFNSAEEAKKAYLMHYNDDRFFGSMTVMPFEQFKRKVLATFKRPQKIAGTSMKFLLQLEKDFGKDFTRRFFAETTQAAKGATKTRPMTATIQRGQLSKTPMPPPVPVFKAAELMYHKEPTMEPIKVAYILGAAEAQRDFDKEAGKEVAITAIRKKILSLLAQKTPGAVDEAAEVARLAIRSEQITPKALETMLKGSKSGAMGTQAEQLRIIMAHGKEKSLIDPALARSWAKTQGKSTEGLPPIYRGGKPVTEGAATKDPFAVDPASPNLQPVKSTPKTAPEAAPKVAPKTAPTPEPIATPAAPPTTAPAPPTATSTPPIQTPVRGSRWQDLVGGAALGAGAGLGGGYLLGKSGAALGDPTFWQGGQEAMGPEGGGEAPPPSAEDAALALPPGIFQGLQLKVNPDGQRSTTVKVTPDALQTPDALAGIFQAEPETKIEMAMAQPTGNEGSGAGPSDVMPQGMPLDGAGAMPMPEVPPKVAELHKIGKKARIERESNPDVSRLYPWKSKKTKAERNANEMIRMKMD